jgi:hypothetical protein
MTALNPTGAPIGAPVGFHHDTPRNRTFGGR